MKSVLKVWEYLSGKKTNIGAVLMIAAQMIPDPTMAEVVSQIGALLAGGGLLHKGVKLTK